MQTLVEFIFVFPCLLLLTWISLLFGQLGWEQVRLQMKATACVRLLQRGESVSVNPPYSIRIEKERLAHEPPPHPLRIPRSVQLITVHLEKIITPIRTLPPIHLEAKSVGVGRFREQ